MKQKISWMKVAGFCKVCYILYNISLKLIDCEKVSSTRDSASTHSAHQTCHILLFPPTPLLSCSFFPFLSLSFWGLGDKTKLKTWTVTWIVHPFQALNADMLQFLQSQVNLTFSPAHPITTPNWWMAFWHLIWASFISVTHQEAQTIWVLFVFSTCHNSKKAYNFLLYIITNICDVFVAISSMVLKINTCA